MQNHRSLRAYQAAQQLAREVYAITADLPASERFGLTGQLRRAAVSIGSNIAEGAGRSTKRDFCSFLDKALGSACEVEFQLGHADSANLLPTRRVTEVVATSIVVQRLLTKLITTIRASESGEHDKGVHGER